ncbi:Uncharacterised protein [Nocardia africana]|uniref:Uncharacterized protein n=1 Tax=Nocardia africana TaxID=134964 RepID=A0A378WUK9_9NOCA|nr:Uncharacterised protein [Nocardia africana]
MGNSSSNRVSGNKFGSGDVHIDQSVKQTIKKRRMIFGGAGVVAVAVVAGSIFATTHSSTSSTTIDASTLEGTWTASDGSGEKVFRGSGQQCRGFFYSDSKPLDIGGPMECDLSQKPDAQQQYTLLVTQSENHGRYKIKFEDRDHASVYDLSGTQLYQLARL